MSILSDWKTYVRANLPSGMTTSDEYFIVNDKRFTNYTQANWYLNYIGKFGFESGAAGSSFSRGYSPAYNAGTTGDWFVAPNGNDTTGDGSLGNPYLTISKAITEATSGDVVKVRAGTYRETVTMKSGVNVEAYGTERPKITGANVLTGLIPCVSGDETYLGPNYTNIYKTGSIALSSLPQSSPLTAFIHENGEPLQLAVAAKENKLHPIHLDAPKDWITADAVNLSSSFIQSFESAQITDVYSDADLESASIAFQGNPNLGYFSEIADVTSGVITIADTGTYTPSANTAIKDNIMIVNLLPAMQQGGWGYRITGTDVIFYVWPNDTDNVASGIEYTVRSEAVKMASNTALIGIEVVQCCAYDAGNPGLGGHAVTEATSTKTENITVSHCNIHNHMRVGTRGYAPVYFRNVDDATLDSCTIENIYGMFGTFIQGGSFSNMGEGQTSQSVDWAMRPLLRRNLYENVGHSPMRVFVSRDGAAMHNQCGESGFAAHANKANCYQYCHNWLWFGNDFTGADGYLTFQDSSAIHWVANYVVVSFEGNDGRAIIDQNAFTNQTPAEAFTLDGTCLVLNNHFAPYSEAIPTSTFPSVTLGRNTLHPEVDFDLRNNIWYGVDIDNVDLEVARSNNYDTKGLSDTATSLSTTYEDAVNGDLTVKSDAPIRGVTGSSIDSALSAVVATMTQIDTSELLIDVNGNSFDTSNPPIGPATGIDVVTSEVLALVPTIAGDLIQGQTLTATESVIYKQPRPTVTVNWQEEISGVWSDVSGATDLTLLLDAGDVGNRIRRRNSTALNDYFSDPSVAVSAPITFPVATLLHTQTYTNNVTQRETSTFDVDGTPIAVIVHAGRSAESIATVTVGASGRGYGTGTIVPLQGDIYRGANTSLHYLQNPGTGTVTIQVEHNVAQNACIIEVVELTNATGVGVVSAGNVVTAASLGATITTGTNDSLILFSGNSNFNTDATAGPVITGATTITSDGSGANFGIGGGTAYEEAATAGAYSATFTWPSSTSIALIAMEILS